MKLKGMPSYIFNILHGRKLLTTCFLSWTYSRLLLYKRISFSCLQKIKQTFQWCIKLKRDEFLVFLLNQTICAFLMFLFSFTFNKNLPQKLWFKQTEILKLHCHHKNWPQKAHLRNPNPCNLTVLFHRSAVSINITKVLLLIFFPFIIIIGTYLVWNK